MCHMTQRQKTFLYMYTNVYTRLSRLVVCDTPASPFGPMAASQKIFRNISVPSLQQESGPESKQICCRAQNLNSRLRKTGTVSTGHLEHAMHAAVDLNPVPSE